LVEHEGQTEKSFSQNNETTAILPGSQRSLTLKGLGKEQTDKTHIERARRLMTNWQIFYFSQQVLYKKERDLNIKNTLT
jgi:uncharacterized protein (UPF0276 family)